VIRVELRYEFSPHPRRVSRERGRVRSTG
jgi:hypothetical protein